MSVAAVQNVEDEGNTLPKTFGEGTDNTVTISADADSKTLTISGKGDLTQIGTSYVFVENNPVFLKGADDNYTTVSKNTVYSAENTYATRAPKYTQIENFKDTYTEVKTHYYFTEAGAGKYYTRQQTSWSETPTYSYTAVNKGDEINKTEYVDGSFKTSYFTKDEGETESYTRVDALATITGNSTDAESKEVTHLKGITSEIFYSSDATNYTQAWNDAVYDESTTYYMRSWEYTTIGLAGLISNAYVRNESDFIKALWANNTYETVKFENTGSDALYIDNDIVKAILYYQKKNDWSTWYESNTTITSFDLSAATVKNLSQATFTNDLGASGTFKITDLTLPLAEKAENGTMTVPSQVLAGLSGYVTTLTIPEGYTALAAHAFGGDGNLGYSQMTVLTSVTFPTTLTTIGDNAFEKCGKLQSVSLNEGLKTIGKYAFWSTDLRSITFPTTLDKIDDAAFMDLKCLTNLKFNAGLRYIGKSAFSWANNADPNNSSGTLVLTTLEIPASVKYIGPSAFKWHEYQDVYFLGEDAPVMPMGKNVDGDEYQVAFDYHTYMINNGMKTDAEEGTLREDTKTGWANRVNYQGTGGQYLAIIHYPKGLTTDKANKYQDQTRVYLTETPYNANDAYYPNTSEPANNYNTMTIYGQISLNTGNQVNYGYKDTYLGEQYIWPNITQVERSYIYNSNGYNWDGTTEYAPELTEAEKAVLIEAGFLTESSSEDEIKAAQKYAHLGTRMFVLGMADANQDKEPDKEPEYPLNIKSGGKWWTLCVPFNMTKAQVKEVFGTTEADPHVCRFNAVDRTEQGSYKKVTLHFQKDVYVHKFTKDANGNYTDQNSTVGDDDIVIYAHEAYMIYPTKILADGEKYTVKNYQYVEGSPNPTIIQANTHNTSYTGTDKKEYRFIGNYVGNTSAASDVDAGDKTKAASVYVPQYSYMYAKKKSDDNYKFWFWAGETANGIVWNPNTCVVQATAKDGGATEYSEIFGSNKSNTSDGAKQVSLFGEADDDVTAIENITIIAGEGTDAQVVYNLNGQPVSNGSLNGLARGIYIQNGKKFVVK